MINIIIRDWHYSCGEPGCCDDYGTDIYVNGTHLDLPSNPDDHLDDTIRAILVACGVDATVERVNEGDDTHG